MKIVVISQSKVLEDEHKIITDLFEAGLGTLHVRKPRLRTKQLIEYIEKIPAHFHNRIIIHSHHNLAGKYNLQGVHYTRMHLEPTFRNWWREKKLGLIKRKLVRTASHNKLASLYDESDIVYDYVFLSPIFDSITGKYQSGFYEDAIQAAVQKTGLKIVARGGIDVTRIEKIQELGLYGAALYSCLWNSEKPLEEFLKIMHRCKELGIEVD
ncbi:MAG: thiamine phosphate synthase [Bacteroidia bacterium]